MLFTLLFWISCHIPQGDLFIANYFIYFHWKSFLCLLWYRLKSNLSMSHRTLYYQGHQFKPHFTTSPDSQHLTSLLFLKCVTRFHFCLHSLGFLCKKSLCSHYLMNFYPSRLALGSDLLCSFFGFPGRFMYSSFLSSC